MVFNYEDLNDHEQLRHDLLLGVAAWQRRLGEPLAGKSALNRMELTLESAVEQRYHKITYSAEAIAELLVNLFLEAEGEAPQRMVLDPLQLRLSLERCVCECVEGIALLNCGSAVHSTKSRHNSQRRITTPQNQGIRYYSAPMPTFALSIAKVLAP